MCGLLFSLLQERHLQLGPNYLCMLLSLTMAIKSDSTFWLLEIFCNLVNILIWGIFSSVRQQAQCFPSPVHNQCGWMAASSMRSVWVQLLFPLRLRSAIRSQTILHNLTHSQFLSGWIEKRGLGGERETEMSHQQTELRLPYEGIHHDITFSVRLYSTFPPKYHSRPFSHKPSWVI